MRQSCRFFGGNKLVCFVPAEFFSAKSNICNMFNCRTWWCSRCSRWSPCTWCACLYRKH